MRRGDARSGRGDRHHRRAAARLLPTRSAGPRRREGHRTASDRAPCLLRRDRGAAWRRGGGGARHDRAGPARVIDLETIRREEFPITRRGIYLDNATLGPPPARHVRAVTEFLQRMSTEGLDDLFAISDEGVDGVRAKAAALLNADEYHVFSVRSTSHGVAVVAEGLTWRDGDEVVLYELDHPAGVFPWLNRADRGVKVSFITDRGRFGFDAADVRELLSPRTRAVCVSLVNFAHGTRADVEEIG